MFRTVTIFIFIIAFASFVSAQETVSPCPTIEVTGATEVVMPGEIIFFTAEIRGDLQNYPVKYKWTIDRGTITSGQGTKIIRVDTTGLEDTTISATFEIIGLPEKCSNSGSETNVIAGIGCGGIPVTIGSVSDDYVRLEIDNLFIVLQNESTATGYLITYGQLKEIKNREKLFEAHIKLRRYDRKRIVLLSGVAETEIRTEVYIVPEGAEPPTP